MSCPNDFRRIIW